MDGQTYVKEADWRVPCFVTFTVKTNHLMKTDVKSSQVSDRAQRRKVSKDRQTSHNFGHPG